jgi:hypothetical protein
MEMTRNASALNRVMMMTIYQLWKVVTQGHHKPNIGGQRGGEGDSCVKQGSKIVVGTIETITYLVPSSMTSTWQMEIEKYSGVARQQEKKKVKLAILNLNF